MESVLSVLFDYQTNKIVSIKSKKVGIINKLLQLIVVGYLVIWVMIIQKGYQQVDRGLFSVTTSLTGVSLTNSRVWDVEDVVVPAKENKQFFVSTKVVVTNHQVQSVCAEDRFVKAARCNHDSDCLPAGRTFPLGNGISDGTCNLTSRTCNIYAWCPTISDEKMPGSHQTLEGVANFTVLIKNQVFFSTYQVKRSNVEGSQFDLTHCRYDSNTNKFCPVFQLGSIVEEALSKQTTVLHFDDIKEEGAVIAIRIKWDCNLDYSVDDCTPTYAFDRLDESGGYNHYYTNNYFVGNQAERQLIKAYGILFVVLVDAEARRFDIIETLYNLGSSLAILVVAQVICDFIITYIMSRREFFKSHKYLTIKDEEEMDCVENNHLFERAGRINYGSVDSDQII